VVGRELEQPTQRSRLSASMNTSVPGSIARGTRRWAAESAARACNSQRRCPCRRRGAQAAGTVVAGGASLGGRERGAGVQLPATAPVPPPCLTGSGHRGGGGRIVGWPRTRRGRAAPSDGARAAAVAHRQRAPWWRGARRWAAESAARACNSQRRRPCRRRGAQAAGTVVAGGRFVRGCGRGTGVQRPAAPCRRIAAALNASPGAGYAAVPVGWSEGVVTAVPTAEKCCVAGGLGQRAPAKLRAVCSAGH